MKKSIQIKRTAHYHIQEGKGNKRLLYVIHGYAQLAEDFLGEFKELQDLDLVIVAPEGISKFYNKEKKAVASWMTSHEREDEIKDYVAYLNQLHEEISKNYNFKEVAVLGFSQGTSTCLRWLCESKTSFCHAHICSGAVPAEIEKGDLDHLKDCQFHYYWGDDDRFIDQSKADDQIHRFSQLVEQLDVIHFPGKHVVSQECKEKIRSWAS